MNILAPRRSRTLLAPGFAACFAFAAAAASPRWPTLDGTAPLVIAHRGASGILPEETIEAYRAAIAMGADAIEPDLVMTKDRVLVARHDLDLAHSTDVATRPRFADRKRRRFVDGIASEGWFAGDFTLAELRTLHGVATDPERPHGADATSHLATFQEIVDLVKRARRDGQDVAIYPETKHPTLHRADGLAIEDSLLAILTRAGWNSPQAPVFVQSFEPGSLRRLRSLGLRTRVVQLIDASDMDLRNGRMVYAAPHDRPYEWTLAGDTARTYAWMTTLEGLAWIRTYADGIGPWKRYILPLRGDLDSLGRLVDRNADGRTDDRDGVAQPATTLVADAHRAGLFVHPFTFRNEPRRLAADDRGSPRSEYVRFFGLGVDGVFSDFADSALAARRDFGRTLRDSPPVE